MKKINQIVGENIRQFRKIRNYTILQLSVLANVDRNYLNNLELGRKNPTIEILERIAEALKVKIYFFFIEVGEKTN